MSNDPKRRNLIIACVLIAVATAAVYAQVAGFKFINYDDNGFITENPMVVAGLSVRGVWWALTTTYWDYWHPLAWISHMMDCELFGLNAGPHHVVSAAFHLLNSLLLLLVFRRITGSVWRSALVAGLFALHPLHVESTAWLAERKDLLCGLFWILTMGAYARYARSGRNRDYYFTALCFLLALMSKPMAVTLPCVLLLMDYWPLARWTPFRVALRAGPDVDTTAAQVVKPLGSLLREKIPFFVITAVISAWTYWAVKTGGNLISENRFSTSLKLANVPVSYARYLLKLIWPADLAPFYRMPPQWGAGPVLLSLAVVAGITAFVIYAGRTRRYLVFGWFFFLGTLIPTIGLVAGGLQSIADRYTYLPFIGLFIMFSWGIAEAATRPAGRVLVGATAVTVLLACTVLSYRQASFWRDSHTLWGHVVAHTPDNPVAQYNLGHEFNTEGNLTEAMKYYRAALRADPQHLDANNNLGLALLRTGQIAEATNYLAQAVALKPDYAKARQNMAMAAYLLGDYPAVTNQLGGILKIGSGATHALNGLALARLGQGQAALVAYSSGIQAAPAEASFYAFAGQTLAVLGRTNEAATIFAEALRRGQQPMNERMDLGILFARLGDPYYAECMASAVVLLPDRIEARIQYAEALGACGQVKRAQASFEETLRLYPDNAPLMNNVAWWLATQPVAAARDGAQAIRLGERACELTGHLQPQFIGTLAAAYAEAGQFDRAVATSRQAADLARAAGLKDLAAINEKLGERYHQHRPFREIPPQ